MSECPICQRGQPFDIIKEGDTVWVTAGPAAPLPGYVCVVAKQHSEEPFDLPPDDRARFWEESMHVAKALSLGLHPKKLNYEIHGNTIPHLHMHLFPRFDGDPFEGRPIDRSEMRFHRTVADLRSLAEVVGAS